jgi:hypothetical protein
VLCLIGYSIRTTKGIVRDLKNKNETYYYPKTTVGTIIGRFGLSFIPVINIFAFFVDLAYDWLDNVAKLIDRVLSTPVIKRK